MKGFRFFAIAVVLTAGVPTRAEEKPNILLIVADDQGYADVGFQGCKDIPTPHLDRLAREGLRCTSGYVTHPFCSPTRAALMTGRYQQRFGHENNPFYDPNDHREGLPLSEKLLPEHLRDAGYVTGWVGKWHLGAAPEFSPLKRGFTETFGFIGGGHRYINWQANPAVEYLVPIERNGKPVDVKDHLTVAFGREASAFVRRHTTDPWFLYLAFNAPHTPLEPTPERVARFASIADPKRRAYAAQVSLMDDAIGEALTALRDTGQDKRTLVFFFSDNGGPIMPGGWNGSSNKPLRGGKGEVYDGGIRVPFVVSWPGRMLAGKDYAPAVSSLDVFATALACAGVPMPTNRTYDSVNLLPFLGGEKPGEPHDRLFWRAHQLWAMRAGLSKLVRKQHAPAEMYDLAADIGETRNLADVQAEKAKELGLALDEWDKELAPPLFEGAGARKQARKKNAAGGNAVIRARAGNSDIVITTTERVAGAIHSLTWNGKEFIDSYDHGRQLQSAANFDCGTGLTGETFNPTEAGSRDDGRGERSSSRLLRLMAGSNSLETTAQMAFWLAPGEKSGANPAKNTTVLSEHLLTKHVQIGCKNLPNVIQYNVIFRVPAGERHQRAVFEAVTGYMPPEFERFWKFNAATGDLEPLSDGPGEQPAPVVLATASGSHAMGIFAPGSPGYGRWRFQAEKVVKWNCVFRRGNATDGLAPGEYAFHMFVIVGDLQTAKESLAALHKLETSGAGALPARMKGGRNGPPPPGALLPTDHEERSIEGWTVRVDRRLLAPPNRERGELALKLLAARLVVVTQVVAQPALDKLRQVPIQLDLDHGGLRSMQYHPSAEWLKAHGYAETLAQCVHIPNADQFISPYETYRQPWAVMHELAHAYHHRVLTYEDARIKEAYERFKAGGRYQNVLFVTGGTQRHYALTNEKEFFAEMTESYFGVNDFFPFVTGELKREEPELYNLLRSIWGPLPER